MTSRSIFKSYIFRISLLLVVAWFLSLDKNPVVVFIAKIGLSPSPLERIFGVKGMFSGMTEGMYRLVHGNFIGAIDANILTPFIAIFFVVCIIFNFHPKIKNRMQEITFLCFVILLSIVVNIANPLSEDYVQLVPYWRLNK